MKLALAMVVGATWCGPIAARRRPNNGCDRDHWTDFPPMPGRRQAAIPTLGASSGKAHRAHDYHQSDRHLANHTTLVTGVRADEHGLLVKWEPGAHGRMAAIKVDPMVDSEDVHSTVYDAAYKPADHGADRLGRHQQRADHYLAFNEMGDAGGPWSRR